MGPASGARGRGIARDEIGGYLQHRLRPAGREPPLFEPATVEAIHGAANACPSIAKAKTITTEHVQAALQEVA